MNRPIPGLALTLAAAAIVLLVSGCVRPMSSGPIPKPLSAESGVATPTPEAIPTEVLSTVVAGATATEASAAEQPTLAPIELPTATPAPVATLAPSSGPTNYTVRPGDRLFSIGRQFGVGPYAIAQANRLSPPYTIYPGQVLVIPGSSSGSVPVPGTGTTYVVQLGDTIYSIGRKLGKSPVAIINANNLINPNRIFPGQVLNIP